MTTTQIISIAAITAVGAVTGVIVNNQVESAKIAKFRSTHRIIIPRSVSSTNPDEIEAFYRGQSDRFEAQKAASK